MISRNLKITLRSLNKNKIFSLINILGLAIGTAAFLLIIHYVRFELSYENFMKEPENIYRVQLDRYLNNELILSSAENFPGVGPALVKELPEVISFTRMYNLGYKNNVIITNEEGDSPVMIKQRRFLYADSSFLNLMGYELLYGESSNALTQPLQAVITEEMSRRYFGDINPIGKTLRMRDDDRNNELCQVTAVIKALPQNTHLKFDVLFSYATLLGRAERTFERYQSSWGRNDMYTYIRLADAATKEQVESKLAQIVNKYSPDLSANNRKDVLSLQPIQDIHLYSNLAEEFESNGEAKSVYLLALIAVFILLTAWINYVNLSTAKAVERAKEVSVRKVLGAIKKQLVVQFLFEAGLVNLLALALSFLIMSGILPEFNRISAQHFQIADFLNPIFIFITLALWLTGTIIAGLYPAFVLSSFKPSSTLRGSFKSNIAGIKLRRFLVIFQFTTSIGLIAATLVVFTQIQHMLTQDMGMEIDQVLVIERPGVVPDNKDLLPQKIDVFRSKVMQNANIEAVSTSFTVPGKKRVYRANIKKFGDSDENAIMVRWNSMDYNFLEVFGMELTAGRTFQKEFASDDQGAMVLTESAIKKMGFADAQAAVNQKFSFVGSESPRTIIGVVNDYSQESLKEVQDPVMFFFTEYGGEFYSLRINSGSNVQEAVAYAKATWDEIFPGNPFEYYFLDDFFNRLYNNDQRFGSLFAVFAFLGIVLACLGLFGLSYYTVNQKTREISIRKVLGSSNPQVMRLIANSFLKLIGIAIFLAIPITYYFMREWLNNYQAKINFPTWVFGVAALSVIIIATLTISFQVIKVSRLNPVNTLKQE